MLVDSHFNTKINGDFGFTQEMPKMISKTVSLKTAKCIAKIIGYNAPEVDICRHSVKTDVYSYGVVSVFVHLTLKIYISICSWYWRRIPIASRMTPNERTLYWYDVIASFINTDLCVDRTQTACS